MEILFLGDKKQLKILHKALVNKKFKSDEVWPNALENDPLVNHFWVGLSDFNYESEDCYKVVTITKDNIKEIINSIK